MLLSLTADKGRLGLWGVFLDLGVCGTGILACWSQIEAPLMLEGTFKLLLLLEKFNLTSSTAADFS